MHTGPLYCLGNQGEARAAKGDSVAAPWAITWDRSRCERRSIRLRETIRNAGCASPIAYRRSVAAVLVLAAAVRWALMLASYRLPNSDQVMVGLMARRILAGERPIFYWGQPYNGTLESYGTAAAFRVFGQSYEALHAAPIASSLLFIGAVVWLGRQLYGPRIALLSGLFLALGPAVLMEFSVWPGYNYLQAMAFGTLSLAIALPIGARGGRWRAAAAAAALGLALYAQPLAVAYAPAVAVLVAGPAVHAWRDPCRRLGIVISACATLVALALVLEPAIAFNLQTHASSLRFLISRPYHQPLTLLERLRRLVLWASPVLTGLVPPNSDQGSFRAFLRGHPLPYAGSLLLTTCGFGYTIYRRPVLVRWIRSIASPRPAGEAALLALALALIAGYLFSSWSSSRWSASEPRYLLPVFTLTPLALRALIPPWAAPRRLAAGGALALTLAIAGLAASAGVPRVASLQPLARTLEADGARAVFGDYWLVYRLTFASHERLLPVATSDRLGAGLNRYPPYLHGALHRPGAWVVVARGVADRALRACLVGKHLRFRSFLYHAVEWLAVYDRIAMPARCLDTRGHTIAIPNPSARRPSLRATTEEVARVTTAGRGVTCSAALARCPVECHGDACLGIRDADRG